MQITIFGFVWIIILIINVMNRNAKYIMGLTLLSMVFQQASVIMLGDKGIGPQIFTSFGMIFWSVIHSNIWTGYKLKINIENKLKIICFFASIFFIGVIVVSRTINLNKYTMGSIEYIMLFMQLLIYFICFFCMWNNKNEIKSNELEHIFVNIIIVVVVIGILQMVAQFNILPISRMMEILIYTNPTALRQAWGYPRVFSTFMEPSYCSPFLVGGFYYLISLGNKKVSYIILALILVCLIILTFSSTAYGTFVIVGFLYLIISKNRKALKYLVPCAIVMILFLTLSGQLMRILNEVIFQKSFTGSAWTRGNLDNYCMEMFKKSYIWGNGYKNIRGSQFLKSLGAQLGIMGIVSWFSFWLPLVIYGLKNSKNTKIVGCTLYILCVVCAMFIAIPDIDIIVFWGAMYFYAATLSVENN